MRETKENASCPCELGFERPDQGTLVIRMAGSWTLNNRCPSAERVLKEMESGPRTENIAFDASALTDWDSGFLIFLTRVIDACSKEGGPATDMKGLPEGARKLLTLAATVPEKKGAEKAPGRASLLSRVGEETVDFFRSSGEILAFIGEASVAFFRFVTGKARFRGSDLTRIIQECGIEALPIVSLISLLVGLILAFVGAVQLMLFGAQIYVADLVGIAMVRVMGAVMTGIIMAGRTGAAFAAQLGTMEVNEEIDAFKTMGISPMEFLVLPRILGLTLMMPLLCLYADFMGVLGGLIVGVGMLDLSVAEYYHQTKSAVGLTNLWIGLFQGTVFGVLVAVAGCLRGLQCSRSASAVGDAATSAVVTGIVSIIVATAVITVICNVLGI
ncbi:MAG: ABC transporter permease [Deltaproteobacteria bacterium]|nr:ABC transporter permease [Deltaproteobacteria bacterium]